MPERLIFIVLILVFLFKVVERLWCYWGHSYDDLYSDYRNHIDVSPAHFKKRIFRLRIVWTLLFIVLFTTEFLLIF